MLTFILITAIALGLTFGANATLFKKKPCLTAVAVPVTAGIAILSAVLGLVVSAFLIEAAGYEVKNIEKAVGPSIAIAIFATWGTIKRRKKGDPLPVDVAQANGPASEAPLAECSQAEPTPAPTTSKAQDTKAIGLQWSRKLRLAVGLGCGLAVLVCLFPPFRMRVTPFPTTPHLKETFTALGFSDAPYTVKERAFFLDPPTPTGRAMGYETEIEWDRLALELTLVGAFSVLLFTLLKEGRWPLR